MYLVVHVLISVFNLGYSIYSVFFPSRKSNLKILFLTLASISTGIYLIFTGQASFDRFCISGVSMIIFSLITSALVRKNLKQKVLDIQI